MAEAFAPMRGYIVSFPILALCMSLLFGCGEGPPPPPDFPPHLMVNFTADTWGSMFPCGCRIPIGGLSRRGGVINPPDGDNPYPQLILDAGGFSGGTTGYDRFTAGWILKIYEEIGYQIVNIGYRESFMPVSQLRELDAVSGGVLISANLEDSQGLPVTRRSLIREVGGIRIGITGVAFTIRADDPREMTREETEMPRLILPVPPLLEVMEKFRDEHVDYVVLLADTITQEVDAILAEVPEIDLVVQGQGFIKTAGVGLRIVNDHTRVVNIGAQGKYLGRMRIDFEPDGAILSEEPMLIELSDSVPTMASVTVLLLQFKMELRERRDEFIGDPSNPFQRPQSTDLVDVLVGYAGAIQCHRCHTQYDLDGQMVGHTVAWRVLDDEHLTDPECLACHSTGYGVPTGLSDPYRDSHLTSVTCEACHGPAGLHVREMYIAQGDLDPENLIPPENPTGLEFSREVPESICMACHTEERSPDFNYLQWLPRVNHTASRESFRPIDRETGEIVGPGFIEESAPE